MKNFAAVLKSMFFASLVLASAHVSAVSCDPDVPCFDGPPIVADGIGDFSYLGGAGGVGPANGGGGSRPGLSIEVAQKLLRAICMPKGPTGCDKWASDQLIKCVEITVPYGYGANTTCRVEVTQEAANSCVNLVECPG